ncbi:hypothetical protein C6P92_15300 [Burkholderia multivorans]|nr:hypothetical protein C6P92_15300 [Burkholderia multivorans]PRG47257.1 hypothetical protein C6T62_03765 [Burkholderia multivorans]PRH02368.1 hypothetical protein C6T60_20185 [Burkholderia multivorans]
MTNPNRSDFPHATERSSHRAACRRVAPVLRTENRRSRLRRTSSKSLFRAPRRHPARRIHRTSRACAPRRDPKDLP